MRVEDPTVRLPGLSKPVTLQRTTLDQSGSLVEDLTSWLTINPVKGCPLDCAYCFRAAWYPSRVPEAATEVGRAVEELVAHPAFVPHETPLAVNVSSTDAMLPQAKESTFRAAELLDQRGLRNPFGVITKLTITPRDVERLLELRHVRPVVFVSLSFLPRRIEPVPVAPRIATMRRIQRAGLPVVHYFRPIMAGLNDAPEVLSRALRIADEYADVMCVGGLRVSREIQRNLAAANYTSRQSSHDITKPPMDEDVMTTLSELHSRLGASVKLCVHTAEAVSHVLSGESQERPMRSITIPL